jgi:S-adenosylhomocysteine hydrolase
MKYKVRVCLNGHFDMEFEVSALSEEKARVKAETLYIEQLMELPMDFDIEEIEENG